MLEPESRLLLLDALRPPPGYSFDRAVGTTFTLDLVALLITPVAFALFDVESEDGRIAANPIAVLESVRRFADRITVFTQAGEIKVPPTFRAAYAYLERSVVAVKAPRPGGIFHPKVWVIRFVASDGDVRFRFLCLSRNLTFDRSWDTVLRLDGRPTEAANELSQPIGDFVRALPGMAIDPVPADRLASINELAAQIATAEWEGLPDGLRLERMWPIGHDGRRGWPFPKDSWRRLVMAPFVEQGFLEQFVKPGRRDVLVSRPETLNALGTPGLAGTGRCFVLRDDALGEADPPEVVEEVGHSGDEERDPAMGAAAPAESVELRGLHVKLFVVDQPYWSHIYTGSANATDAAFNANVEFLVEVKGRNTTNCADCLVAAPDGNAIGFGRLLEEYQPSSEPVPLPDDEEAARALEGIAMQIGSLRFRAEVGEPNDDVFPLRLTASGDLRALRPHKGESLTIGVRPLSRGAGWAVAPTVDSGSFTAEWQVSFDAITAFFAVELVARRGAAETKASFVVRAELVGEPADRLQRVLASELKNRSDLVRLLLMLLGGSDPAFGDLVDVMTGEPVVGDGTERSVVGSDALLEPLMRTLARNPKRLDEIGRLVAELAKTEEGKTLLPEGWLDVWAAVEAARPHGAVGDA
jgi:hypothetical protein